MGFSFGELLILMFVPCCVLFPLIGAIVGIRRALRRGRCGVRSVGAVVWASLAVAMALPAAVSPVFPLGLAEVILTIIWIVYAVKANRQAARMDEAEAQAAA